MIEFFKLEDDMFARWTGESERGQSAEVSFILKDGEFRQYAWTGIIPGRLKIEVQKIVERAWLEHTVLMQITEAERGSE